MTHEEQAYQRIVDLFLSGRLPRMNHARHIAVGNLLRREPHGLALMHLGLQITAIRAGAAHKYDRAITDQEWSKLDGTLPSLREFEDVLGA